MDDVMIDTRKPLNAKNLKSMGILDQVKFKPTQDTSWEALKDQRKIPNGLYLFSKEDPREVILYYLDDLKRQGVDISDFNISQLPDKPPNFMKHPRGPSEKAKQAKKARLGESSGSRPPAPLTGPFGKSVSLTPSAQTHPISSSIPQPTPIYTNSETPPSTTRTSHQPSQKFNLATTTLPVSEAEMLNETISPSSSSSPESPPTTTSPQIQNTLAQLQTRALASQQPTQLTPNPEVTSLPIEQPNPTTSDPQPSETPHAKTHPNNSDTHPPNTSAEPQTPTLHLIPPPSPPPPSEPENTLPTLEEAIMLFVGASIDKVKSLTINSGISDDPSAIKEAEAKALTEAAAAAEVEAKAAAEAEAKATAKAEARRAEEYANRVAPDALTQGESSTFVPLVLKTLEDLQKEQKEV
ncbi:extensin-like [Lathyrus oleraceus]|uniref:extensin-like n=1 Tax=Pisum sativum TaxID=3888 RepID=UPI0021D12BB1|nr:extensin-like [Pisum sativum]